ncbi:MAG TPA: 16S rRNA (guanine(527)-N(7))-methyltransferase RsmG [Acidobacteriaceae bacterium]
MTAAARLQAILASLGQPPLPGAQALAFETYLELLLRWNARVNLSAIHDQEGILRRHFVESICCARLLPAGLTTLLDYGSGAGFPGIPCAICRPELAVTLAESQSRKAAFLQEAARTLPLQCTVYPGRVQAMEPSLLFDVVTLRAVDRMQEACASALTRVKPSGWLAIMATQQSLAGLVEGLQPVAWRSPTPLPGTEQQVLLLGRKLQ